MFHYGFDGEGGRKQDCLWHFLSFLVLVPLWCLSLSYCEGGLFQVSVYMYVLMCVLKWACCCFLKLAKVWVVHSSPSLNSLCCVWDSASFWRAVYDVALKQLLSNIDFRKSGKGNMACFAFRKTFLFCSGFSNGGTACVPSCDVWSACEEQVL